MSQKTSGDGGFTLSFATPQDVIGRPQGSLAELLDGLLGHGVVIRGELWLSVAEVDLVFVGLDLVLSSPEVMEKGRRVQ